MTEFQHRHRAATDTVRATLMLGAAWLLLGAAEPAARIVVTLPAASAAKASDRLLIFAEPATAENERYPVGHSVKIATRGAAREFRVVGVARFGTVKSLGTVTAAGRS